MRQFKDYGKLSKRDIEKLIAGARIDINEGKKDPLDFVLWKLAKPTEPQWPSPWRNGRPGWHIECSAMAENILGHSFDIHGGGMDLKFPHHENEIAQSEAAHHQTFAHYWMHAGLLNVNGEKMSKSLGNFFTIKEVLAKHPVEVIRYFMLSSHYRSPVDYSDDTMQQAQQALTRLYTALRGLPTPTPTPTPTAFTAAMNDDFNTPIALSALFDMAKEINILREANKIPEAAVIASTLKKCGEILGILQMDPDSFLRGNVNDELTQQIEQYIADRLLAKKNKNYAEADRIRQVLQEMNVIIEDSASGTTWRKI